MRDFGRLDHEGGRRIAELEGHSGAGTMVAEARAGCRDPTRVQFHFGRQQELLRDRPGAPAEEAEFGPVVGDQRQDLDLTRGNDEVLAGVEKPGRIQFRESGRVRRKIRGRIIFKEETAVPIRVPSGRRLRFARRQSHNEERHREPATDSCPHGCSPRVPPSHSTESGRQDARRHQSDQGRRRAGGTKAASSRGSPGWAARRPCHAGAVQADTAIQGGQAAIRGGPDLSPVSPA